MAVKVKYKTKLDITKDMLKNISNVNGKRIEVGCFNGDHAWLVGSGRNRRINGIRGAVGVELCRTNRRRIGHFEI